MNERKNQETKERPRSPAGTWRRPIGRRVATFPATPVIRFNPPSAIRSRPSRSRSLPLMAPGKAPARARTFPSDGDPIYIHITVSSLPRHHYQILLQFLRSVNYHPPLIGAVGRPSRGAKL
ncbi:hypothetical protein NL676_018312 [Syzygium grande]|nr:hypothetical protein NL676_018312 [Syzygium grande]